MDNLTKKFESLIPQGSIILPIGQQDIWQSLAKNCSLTFLPTIFAPVGEEAKLALSAIALQSPNWSSAEVVIALRLNRMTKLSTLGNLFQAGADTGKQFVFSWHFPADTTTAMEGERDALEQFMARHGLKIIANQWLPGEGFLVKGVATPLSAPSKTKKVAILSYGNISNFGDRLGLHLINRLLPAHVIRKNIFFNPMEVSDERFDLLILGIGNSLFRQVLTPHLLELMDRCEQSIGIFGTQYRPELPVATLNQVLDRLTFWWARNKDDVLLYGRGRHNVHHLGDWLIAEFPMAESRKEFLLRIDETTTHMPPLDVAIQTIQEHRMVFSKRIHPFLCALTSAERVAYEDRIFEGVGTGKFHSLLMDIFDRVYPEKEMFLVDRQSVMAYRHKVLLNIERLAKQLADILS